MEIITHHTLTRLDTEIAEWLANPRQLTAAERLAHAEQLLRSASSYLIAWACLLEDEARAALAEDKPPPG